MSPDREVGREPDREEGRRLYKARGPDGEVAWVDHDGLWRLQQRQAEELRRQHARRRGLLLLTLAALVAVALVLVLLRLGSRFGPPPAPPAVEAPAGPETAGEEPAASAVEPAADSAGADSRTGGAGSGPAVTPPSEEQAETAPVAGPTQRVAATVRAWAEAWARQDLAAYLGSYAASFRPPEGMSRSSWEELRRRRVTEPATIRVEIERLRITPLEQGAFEARFVQRYLSPRYSDVVDKRLRLVEEAGEWRIEAEQAGAPRGG